MNFIQLIAFTQNLAQMLEAGIPLPRALDIASRSMLHHSNRKFAD